MASPMSLEELEKQLKDVGTRLAKPPSSTQDLLNLLDETEHLLCEVEQGPSNSTRDALRPSMDALVCSELMRHSDTGVKVSVASCISEITRIMAPNTPYNDEQMKEFFQLSMVAVEQLSSTSGRSYLKAVSVLKTFANIRVFVLMLDLELDELIVRMFHQFLDVNRCSQSDDVLLAMEKIMTLVIEESEEPSVELLSLLLSSVKMENQNVLPQSWQLGQKILKSCADKLRPDLPKVVISMGIAYHDYADIVASICQVTLTRDNAETKDPVSEDILVQEVGQAADEQLRLAMDNDGVITKSPITPVNEKFLEGCLEKSVESLSISQRENMETAVEQEIQKKRGRKPNSLRKEEEGYDRTWIIGVSNSLRVPCRGKNPKKKLCNLSKDSVLEMASASDQGKEPQSHVSSVKKVSGKVLSSSQNHSILEEDQSGIPSRGPHANQTESSLNPETDLNLLSVSEGRLLQTRDGEETPERILATSSKRSRSISGCKGNHRGVIGNNASGSAKNGTAKGRRVRRKNVSECTRDSAEKDGMSHEENLSCTKTDGICVAQEIKEEFPVWKRDNMKQKRGVNVPVGDATEKPISGIGIDGASKVRRKRKSTTLLKEKDHDSELVGRKIKVWWPEDKDFYSGVIAGFDQATKKHMVIYNDGDQEKIYLGTERWEFIEDAEDSMASKDNKLDVISLSKETAYTPRRTISFCGAQTDSSFPATTNCKASSTSPKKRTSSSCGKSKPEEADTGKRTKRRTLHDEKGKKSLAKILTINQEPESTKQVVKECSMQVDVSGYKVKASNAPVLTAIFAKYGDIAANCLYKSASVRTFMLEVVCDIVKRLQSDTTAVIVSELQSLENEVSDAEAAKLEVSWLREYLENLRGVEVGESSSLLKDMKVNTILVSKAAKRDLEQKQVELAAAQERVREAESCVKALALVAKKISTDISIHEAEVSAWRKPLNDLGKP